MCRQKIIISNDETVCRVKSIIAVPLITMTIYTAYKSSVQYTHMRLPLPKNANDRMMEEKKKRKKKAEENNNCLL